MSDPVYPPRRPGSAHAAGDNQSSDPPRRGRPVHDADEDLSKVYPRRVKSVNETTAPPRRLQPELGDLPPRLPGSAVARPATPTLKPDPKVEHEPDGEPGSSDMTITINKQRIAKLLTAEWVRWGRDHRQAFEDGVVEAVQLLFLKPQAAGGTSKSSTPEGEAAPRTVPHSASTTTSPQVMDEQPEPED